MSAYDHFIDPDRPSIPRYTWWSLITANYDSHERHALETYAREWAALVTLESVERQWKAYGWTGKGPFDQEGNHQEGA